MHQFRTGNHVHAEAHVRRFDVVDASTDGDSPLDGASISTWTSAPHRRVQGDPITVNATRAHRPEDTPRYLRPQSIRNEAALKAMIRAHEAAHAIPEDQSDGASL